MKLDTNAFTVFTCCAASAILVVESEEEVNKDEESCIVVSGALASSCGGLCNCFAGSGKLGEECVGVGEDAFVMPVKQNTTS